MNHQTILGIVLPCYNEEAVLSETILRLNKVLEDLVQKDKISINSFMIFVDDGSKDNTWNLIENVSKNNKFVKGLKLSTFWFTLVSNIFLSFNAFRKFICILYSP